MALQWWQGLVAGGVATAVMTMLMQMGGAMGMTRMNMPIMLGSMLTRDATRASVLGWIMHALNGLVFGLLYAVVFWAVDPAASRAPGGSASSLVPVTGSSRWRRCHS